MAEGYNQQIIIYVPTTNKKEELMQPRNRAFEHSMPLLTYEKLHSMESRAIHFCTSECRKKRKLGRDLLNAVDWILFWRKYISLPSEMRDFELMGSGINITDSSVMKYLNDRIATLEDLVNKVVNSENDAIALSTLKKVRADLFPAKYKK